MQFCKAGAGGLGPGLEAGAGGLGPGLEAVGNCRELEYFLLYSKYIYII